MIKLTRSDCNFEREPLRGAFGFKGRYLTELWQVVSRLDAAAGEAPGVGLGTQSVLWSDAAIFERYSEAASNALMFQLTAFALKRAEGRCFSHPLELTTELFPEVLAHGRMLTGGSRLRPTFALNSLVSVDNAAWILYAKARGLPPLERLIREDERPALSARHQSLGCIPLISYATPVEQAEALAKAGHFVLKIKIGNDPEGDGDPLKMLEWDCRRLSQLHERLADGRTPHTRNGSIGYYLDANGRYDSPDRVAQLLEHCDRIGALRHIVMLEEPFPEEARFPVHDLPVAMAADESAHSVEDVTERIGLGYRVIALKPVAKTLSISLQMAAEAQRLGAACFCADLTVNPILVDWNKSVGARLAPLPGLTMGVMETNGAQYYRNWMQLRSHHPSPGSEWGEPKGGIFNLGEEFHCTNGLMFERSEHYASLVNA